MSINARLIGRNANTDVEETSVKSTLSIEEGGQDISLNLVETDVLTYAKDTNDLVITLKNGETLTITDYFLTEDGGAKNRLFLSESGEISAVDLAHIDPSLSIATINASAPPAADLAFSEGSSFGSEGGLSAGALTWGAIALGGVASLALVSGSDDSDEPAPVAPTLNAVDAADATPLITGTAEPESTVVIEINGRAFTTAVGMDGNFSIDTGSITPDDGDPFEPLVDGNYEVTVSALDSGGSTTDNAVVGQVTLDTAPPEEPSVSLDGNNLITGTAEPGSTINILNAAGDVIGTGTADSATGEFSIMPSPAPGEGETIEVVAIDVAGNASTPTAEAIDTVAPVAPTVNPTDGDLITGSAEPNATVNILGGNNDVIGTGIADSESGQFSIAPTSIPADGEVVEVVAVDAAGNESESTAFTIDATAPIAPTVNPTDGDVITGIAELGSTVSVFADNGDLIGTGADGDLIGEGTADPETGDFSIMLSPVPSDGDVIEVVVVDAAGNESESTFETVDATAPAEPLVTLIETNEATPVLEGTAEAGSVVTIEVGGATYEVTATPAGTWSVNTETAMPITGTFSPDENGANEVVVMSTDAAGNTSSDTTAGELVLDTTLPAPTITLDASITADNVINIAESAGMVTIAGTVGGDAQDGDTVTLTINNMEYTGTVVSSAFSVAVAGSDLALDTTVSASISTTDSAGNTATVTDTVTYEVDVIAPEVFISSFQLPTINIPLSTATAAEERLVAIGEVVGVQDGDIVTISANGVQYTGVVTSGTFSIPLDGENVLAETGENVGVQITTTDAAGNTITLNDAQGFSVDLSVPVIDIQLRFTISEDNVVDIADLEGLVRIDGDIEGDFQSGDTVTVTVNGVETSALVSDFENPNFLDIFVAGSDLAADADRTVVASITTTNAAGNSATAIDILPYFVDLTPPVPTITLGAITADNVINIAESAGSVTIAGTVGGDAQEGDTVTLIINNMEYTGTVASSAFSIAVAGSDLALGTTVSASVSTTENFGIGNSATATDTVTYEVDVTAPVPTITLDSFISNDGYINIEESQGIVTVEGRVGGDAQIGDIVTLTVDGETVGQGAVEAGAFGNGAFSIDVEGADLAANVTGLFERREITASVFTTDPAGNSATATDTEDYAVNFFAPEPIIESAVINTISDDSASGVVTIVNTELVEQDMLSISGTISGAVDSDLVTVTVNGVDYTGNLLGGVFNIPVNVEDLVESGDGTASFQVSVESFDPIVLNRGLATETFEYTVDVTAPVPTITFDPFIFFDGFISIPESQGIVTVEGRVGGDAQIGDIVTLTVDGETVGQGAVEAGAFGNGAFSIDVEGADLAANVTGLFESREITASVVTTDSAGNSATATDTEGYAVNFFVTEPIIESVGINANADDFAPGTGLFVNTELAEQEVLFISGMIGLAFDSDPVTVTINGVDYTGNLPGGVFNIPVNVEDLIANGEGQAFFQVSVDTVDITTLNPGTTTELFEYTVDLTAPEPTINELALGPNTVISGTGEANTDVELFDALNNSIGIATTNGDGEYSLIPVTPLEDGAVISISQTDIVGNIGTATQTIAIEDVVVLGAGDEELPDDGSTVLDDFTILPDTNENLLIGLDEFISQAGLSSESIPLQSDLPMMDINKITLLGDLESTPEAKIEIDLDSFIVKTDIDLGAFNSNMDVALSRLSSSDEMTTSEMIGGVDLIRDDEAVSVV